MKLTPEIKALLGQYETEMVEVLKRNESGPGHRRKLFDLESKLNALGINNKTPEFKRAVEDAHATYAASKK
jgi:hypothetical protein